MPRAILCILDSFGIGGAPDAADYSDGHGHPDTGADTLGHIAANYDLYLPNMDAMGLGAAGKLSTGTLARGLSAEPKAGRYGAGREISKGKDTPSGHWEIAGVPVPFAWGYFPQTVPTFPKELTDALIKSAGLPGILGNKHASGTTIIAELGEESIRTQKPICYTSIDSVFQIAASEEHFGLQRLYDVCEAAFKLTAPMMIGRVIARPFTGETRDTFKRTGNRRDFAIAPPEPTLLDRAKDAGRQVFAIGKISDIYAGHGVTHKIKASGNMVLFDRTLEALDMAAGRRVHHDQFRRFRPGVRAPPRHPGICAGARGLRRAVAGVDRRAARRRPAGADRRPRQRSELDRLGSHPRTGADSLLFPKAQRRDGWIRPTFADIGESIAHWLGLAPGKHGRSFL